MWEYGDNFFAIIYVYIYMIYFPGPTKYSYIDTELMLFIDLFLNYWLNIPIEYWETNTEEQQKPSLYTYIIPEEIKVIC